MAEKKRYEAPRLRRREKLARVTEELPAVTGRLPA
jgi:hypothetical protein